MGILKYALDDQGPYKTVCGKLEDLRNLFGILSNTSGMFFVVVLDTDGAEDRWWHCQGYTVRKGN